MKRKVAIFDIDGTIFRSSLLIELVELLIQREIFPPSARKVYQKTNHSWLSRTGSYEEYINDVISVFETHLKGISYEDFITAAKDVVEEKRYYVYRYTRDLVRKLKKDGYFLLAISQSPKGILDEFCKELGFDKVYGRFYELGSTDLFTGETVDIHLISNKANIVKRVVEKEDLTLKDSVGIGDSEGDIPMLEMVENPICFNPNSILYKTAKINKWKIVVERKDVIYEIQ